MRRPQPMVKQVHLGIGFLVTKALIRKKLVGGLSEISKTVEDLHKSFR